MINGTLVLGVYPPASDKCPQLQICPSNIKQCDQLNPYGEIWCLLLKESQIPYRLRALNAADSSEHMIMKGQIFSSNTPSVLSSQLAKHFQPSRSLTDIHWGFMAHEDISQTSYDASAILNAFSSVLWIAILISTTLLLISFLVVSISRSPSTMPLITKIQNIMWFLPSKQFNDPSKDVRSTKLLLFLYGVMFIFFIPLFRSRLLSQILLRKRDFGFDTLAGLIDVAMKKRVDVYIPAILSGSGYGQRAMDRFKADGIEWKYLDLQQAYKLIRGSKSKASKSVILAERAVFKVLTEMSREFCSYEFLLDSSYQTENQVFLFNRNSHIEVVAKLNKVVMEYKLAIDLILQGVFFGQRSVCGTSGGSNQKITLQNIWPWFLIMLTLYTVAIIIYVTGHVLHMIQRYQNKKHNNLIYVVQQDQLQLLAELKLFARAQERLKYFVDTAMYGIPKVRSNTGLKANKDFMFIAAKSKQLRLIMRWMDVQRRQTNCDVERAIREIDDLIYQTNKYIHFNH